MAPSRHVPIGPARAAAESLVARYGTIRQAAEAIDIPYKTLQGILNEDKLTRVYRTTSDRVIAAAANPPNVIPRATWDRRFIPIEDVYDSVMKLEKHYHGLARASEAVGVSESSMRMIKGRYKRGILRDVGIKILAAAADPPEDLTLSSWDKRYVLADRVRPLVLFLEKAYGSINNVGEILEIPPATLRGIKTLKSPGVSRKIAAQIVDGVQALRHGDRSWSTYENEGPPRFATSEEQGLPNGFTRWRHAGGKTK